MITPCQRSAHSSALSSRCLREYAPPHFHALYAEYEAEIDTRTLEVLKGKLPGRAQALVLEWAAEHRNELMEDWALCQAKQLPKKIPPLE